MKFEPGTLLNPIRNIIKVPDELFDQQQGAYIMGNDPTPCCVGAHLAHYLEADRERGDDFLRGIDKWIGLVNGNRGHAILMLRHAGSGIDPIGPFEWKTKPAEVWKNLWKIEQLPSLSQADFMCMNFEKANMRSVALQVDYPEKCSYYKTDFSSAFLEGANFAGTDMRGALLTNANLRYANFEGADLSRAWIDNVRLHETNFKNANMTKAVFKVRSNNISRLGSSSFKGLITQNACISEALLEHIGCAQ